MTSAPPLFTSSGMISGTGFAIASTIAPFAMRRISSAFTRFGPETPSRMSAPTSASFRPPLILRLLNFASARLCDVCLEPSTIPLLSSTMMSFAPAACKNRFAPPPRQTPRGRRPCGSRTENHDASRSKFLSHDLQGVQDCSKNNYRGSVLIVMHHGDIECLNDATLDVETFRRGDVFEIDTAERWCNCNNGFNDFIRLLCIKHNRHGVHSRKRFENRALSFHDWKRGKCADIPEPEHSRAIGDDCDCALLHGIHARKLRIFCYHT